MKINIGRIVKDINVLSSFNATIGEGCTRFSYSKEDKMAREYIISEMKKIGLKVMVDAIGNIRGRLEGINPDLPMVISGSHIDTVYKGGKYDGVLGVVCALEVARTLVENKVKLKNPYEVLVFTEEEGSNFGYNLVGSKALIGECQVSKLKELKDKDGESMYEKIKCLGVNPDEIESCTLNPNKVKGMIELHVEQGNILFEENKSVGIVRGIAGLNWYEIEIKGKPNHAGATPMAYRKDPIVKAASIISSLPILVKEKGDDTTVATVGTISCKPSMINVIAESVKFTIDLRGMNNDAVDRVISEVKDKLMILNNEGFECKITQIAKASEVKLSEKLLNIIEDSAKEEHIDYRNIYSGANHDSSIMAKFTEVAMIFVPSVDGRSHCREEFTKKEDIEKGCQVLFKTIYKLTCL